MPHRIGMRRAPLAPRSPRPAAAVALAALCCFLLFRLSSTMPLPGERRERSEQGLHSGPQPPFRAVRVRGGGCTAAIRTEEQLGAVSSGLQAWFVREACVVKSRIKFGSGGSVLTFFFFFKRQK